MKGAFTVTQKTQKIASHCPSQADQAMDPDEIVFLRYRAKGTTLKAEYLLVLA